LSNSTANRSRSARARSSMSNRPAISSRMIPPRLGTGNHGEEADAYRGLRTLSGTATANHNRSPSLLAAVARPSLDRK
jgi:hypothetical protein